MTLYSTHFGPVDPAHAEQPPMLVPEGFSWWGLVIGWFVLLRPGSWLVALLAGIATLLIKILAHRFEAAWVLLPGLHLTVALFVNDWRRWELGLAGMTPGPIVAGPDCDTALLRLLDQRPDLLGRAPAALS